MARDEVKEATESWFDPSTLEGNHVWVERLEDALPVYQEMGYTKGEGAMLFSMNHLLMQASKIQSLLIEIRDLLDTGKTPT